MFNVNIMNYLLISILGRFLASMIGALALIYIFKTFQKALKNNSKLLLWWAFTQALFLLLLILFAFRANTL